MRLTSLHRYDAMRLLEDGKPHSLRFWKLSTGDIVDLPQAVCTSRHTKGGTHNVLLPTSRAVRKLRDITIFEVDGLAVYW